MARLRGKRFSCRALSGRSGLNLCINSDLTVSCSSHDIDGTGKIGDLKQQSFHEVYTGPAADRFRRTLAAGRLPLAHCARCPDLQVAGRGAAEAAVESYASPRFVMLENTSRCNLRCLACPRDQIRGLRSAATVGLDDLERVVGELREAGIEHIGYLNLGEPFLPRTILQEVQTIRRVHPEVYLTTSTNGTPIKTDEKREAAMHFDRVEISVDGIDHKMLARYRRGARFDVIYRNMRELVRYRDALGRRVPELVWKYLLFRWTEHRSAVRRAIELAREAGVDAIAFEKTVSPFYGIPIRSYLGLHGRLGEEVCGARVVRLRQEAPDQATPGSKTSEVFEASEV